jgi:acyl-CoA thioesterase-1
MQVPPNLGPDYTEQFKSMYPEIAKEKNVNLIPFLLEDVGGNPDLNQGDGIHPTAEGHKIIAETVWEELKPILQELRT